MVMIGSSPADRAQQLLRALIDPEYAKQVIIEEPAEGLKRGHMEVPMEPFRGTILDQQPPVRLFVNLKPELFLNNLGTPKNLQIAGQYGSNKIALYPASSIGELASILAHEHKHHLDLRMVKGNHVVFNIIKILSWLCLGILMFYLVNWWAAAIVLVALKFGYYWIDPIEFRAKWYARKRQRDYLQALRKVIYPPG